MPTWDATDTAAMLDVFGEQVFIETAGDRRKVVAIFDNDYRQVDLGDGQVATRAPVLTVATSAIDAIIDAGEVGESGTNALVRGTQYRVISHQPDGTGFSLLILAQEV